MDTEFVHEHRALISVAESCWRPIEPSHSWHVFDWMAWKLRQKYPLLMRNSGVITMTVTS